MSARRALALGPLALAVGCTAPPPAPSLAAPGLQQTDLDRAYAELDLTPFDNDSERVWRERGTLVFGERTFDSSFGLGRADQAVLGFELVGAPPGSWVELELGLFGSARGRGAGEWLDQVFGEPLAEDLLDDGVGIGTSSLEFSLGVQKRLLLFGGQVRPFVGGGAAAIRRRSFRAESEGVQDDSDSDLGWYAHAGVHVLWGNGVGIGIDVRRLGGTDLVLEGLPTSGDYEQWALSFGFGI